MFKKTSWYSGYNSRANQTQRLYSCREAPLSFHSTEEDSRWSKQEKEKEEEIKEEEGGA